MLTTSTDSDAQSVLGTSAGKLMLALKRGCQVQLIDIHAAKTSIGSDEGCDIQLSGEDIAPVECVILRGPRQSVVRSWTPHVRRNGEVFSDAIVQVGDVLSFGDVTLEFVDDSRESEEASDPDGREVTDIGHEGSDAFEGTVGPDIAGSEVEDFEPPEQCFDADVDVGKADFVDDQIDGDDPFVILQRNLELAAVDGVFTNDEEHSDEEHSDEAYPVEECCHDEQNDRSLERGDYQPVAEEDLSFESPEETPPVDAATVLQQLGHCDAVELVENEAVENETVEPTSIIPSKESTSQAHAAEEESSIESYMKRLLERVGTEGPPLTDADQAERLVEASSGDVETVEDNRPLAAWPPAKKSSAPERAKDLAAMRELANESTRTAIRQHTKRNKKDGARSKIVYSVAMILGSAILLTLSRLQSNVITLAGALLLGIALNTLFQGIKNGSVFQVGTGKRRSTRKRSTKRRKKGKKARKKT